MGDGVFWRCTCGHPLYEHGRRTVPNAGIQEYHACGHERCLCGSYRAADGSAWPGGPAGKVAA